MLLTRRRAAALLAAAAAVPALPGRAEWRVAVTDMIGRPVTLTAKVERVVLLDARDALTMAMLHPDPSALIVGWAGAETFDSDAVRRQYETRSDGSAIPVVGGQTADTVSVEAILALAPDLVVATAHVEPELADGALTRRLAAAGVPVIFSNAASNRPADPGASANPLAGLGTLMQLWGAVLGREAEALAFGRFIDERLAFVRDRLQAAAPVTTYLELQSTYDDCCWAAGNRIWGDLLALAGGRNLSAVDAPWFAKVATEQLIAEAPAVYIASGGAYAAGMRPAIGPGLDPDAGRAGLARLCERTGFATLPAVRDGRVHGIWTGLITVQPLNILFVEVAAKWLHPGLFADTDPADTLNDINSRFLAKPIGGPCWLSLTEFERQNG